MLAANRKILTVLRAVPTMFEVFSVDGEIRMLIKYRQIYSACLKDEEINLKSNWG